MSQDMTKEELKAQVAQLEGEKKELQEQVKQQNEDAKILGATITELQEELEALQNAPAKSEAAEITHKKKKYRVMIPRFRFEAKEYALSDLQENEDLVSAILEKEGQGILKPVKK